MTAQSASRQLFERARGIVPAGVSSNTRARKPHPHYFRKASGAWAQDVDGNRHLDIVMGNGAILLGHNHVEVFEAVRKCLASGLTCGLESDQMCDAAQKLLDAARWPDLVRFANTGTEAVLHAIHVARHATGRTRLAKVEGSYHGWSDELFVSVWIDPARSGAPEDIVPQPQFAGQRQDLVAETVVLPFNNLELTEAALDRHGSEIAAVLLEPTLIDVGYIPASDEYLSLLRKLTRKHGIVLIYDELLTGLNTSIGGVGRQSGITPDLALFGKAIANGFPLAAVAGSEELMRMTEPGCGPAFVGTFNGHAVSIAAASAALSVLATGEVQRAVSQRGARLKASFESEARRLGIPAQFATGGSHFHWYFCDTEIVDFRTAATTRSDFYEAFTRSLAQSQLVTLPNPLSHHAISLAHDEPVLSRLEEAFAKALDAVAAMI